VAIDCPSQTSSSIRPRATNSVKPPSQLATRKIRLRSARFSGGHQSVVSPATESQQLSGYIDEA
jgi:hypothetical protein